MDSPHQIRVEAQARTSDRARSSARAPRSIIVTGRQIHGLQNVGVPGTTGRLRRWLRNMSRSVNLCSVIAGRTAPGQQDHVIESSATARALRSVAAEWIVGECALLLGLAGCTSFGAVRSAEVHPGPSVVTQASVITTGGDEGRFAWFDCSINCTVFSGEFGLTLGWRPSGKAGAAFALGGGLSGFNPYAEGYLQLRSSGNPYGIGARVGWGAWDGDRHLAHEIMGFGRYDIALPNGKRVALNPGLVYRSGNAPNGEEPHELAAAVLGAGLLRTRAHTTLTPGAALIMGRGRVREESFLATLFVFSVTIALHAPR
jgi:hypothetical protein